MKQVTNELTHTYIQTISSSDAYRNFIHSCRSPATVETYNRALKCFMEFLKIDRNAYDQLLQKDPKLIQMDICNFIMYLRKEKNPPASSSAVSTYVAAINKFYAMNDLLFNQKRIKSYMGDHEKVAEDRPYTHAEIATLLGNTALRNRAIILLMSSSGPRLGAIPLLRIKDLTPISIDNYNIYKIHYYALSKKSNYYSYCTPECRHEIDNYLEWRKRWGERLTDNSPLFRTDYNAVTGTVDGAVGGPGAPVSKSGIRNMMWVLLQHTGLRKVPTEGESSKRWHIMMTHGLRKFFETNAHKAGMDLIYIRRLMGQKGGQSALEDSYLKLTDEELLDGDSRHVGYIGIIDQLTISNEHRLKQEVQTLKIDKNKMEQVLERINLLEDKILNQ